MKRRFSIGIDPGTANIGIAVLCNDYGLGCVRTKCHTEYLHINVNDIYRVVDNMLVDYAMEKSESTSSYIGNMVLGIERFVPYSGRHTRVEEDIQLLIGGLMYKFGTMGMPIYSFRAIDWKPAVCKHLYKVHGFKNPSSTFDKKYSMAAAKLIAGNTLEIETDHEADALCIAYAARYHDEMKLK